MPTTRRVDRRGRIVDEAYESRAAVIDSFREERVPLDEDEIERMREGRSHSGVSTGEDDIDEILYG